MRTGEMAVVTADVSTSEIFLKTIIPSRKATKQYGGESERTAVKRLPRVR